MTDQGFMQAFSDAVKEISSGIYTFTPIPTFTAAKARIAGVRSEYHAEGDRIQFHFWKDPEFPQDFADAIQRALRAFPPNDVLVEYVPEVDSWYTHVGNLPLGASAELAERLIRKISEALDG